MARSTIRAVTARGAPRTRTARSAPWAALAFLLSAGPSALLAGCTDDAFCFNCEGGAAAGDGGSGGSAGQAGAGNGGSGGSVVVIGGNGGTGDCASADLATDPQNCGACGVVCKLPGSQPTCAAGKCVLDCAPGFFDLDKQEGNGCEYACTPSNSGVELCDEVDNDCDGLVDEDASTAGDVNHCGACKAPCILPNGVPSCVQGACAIAECLPGFTDGDKDPKNGCEYACGVSNGGVEVCDGLDNDCNGQVDDSPDTSSDPKNCGACGNDCTGKFANMEPTCQGGQCAPGACLPGFFDLDKDPATGCEYSCTNTCSPPFAVPKCDDQGGCAILECQPGHYDLNQLVEDGCEYACDPTNGGVETCDLIDNNCNGVVDDPSLVDTSSDPKNCGACGASCAGKFANGEPTCQGGQCALGACQQGYLDKDGDPLNGCEYSCESLCSFPFAVPQCDAAGSCSMGSCLPGFYDLNSDSSDGCEYACSPTNGGVEVCDKKDNDCNGVVDDPSLVDTSSDPFNCGACGASCAGKFANAEPTCQGGQCVLGGCLTGYTDVDKNAANGCEYNCQASCSFPFATGVCGPGGSCTFGQCLLDHYDLNSDPSDGCEYACAPTGASELCDGKDNNCDGQVDEGFSFASDPNNCGSCGKRCDVLFPNATVACQPQGGVPTCVSTGCKPGFFDDDGNPANGCEYGCIATGPEVCDGKDNDCDGIADNPPGGVFAQPLPEQCAPGSSTGVCSSKTVCQNGQPVCAQVVGPSTEICDGLDNDCDGQTDEGAMPQVGVPCGTSQVGECKFGTTSCQNGAVQCQGKVDPKPETCNGKDDDCDGVVDDNPSGVGAPCGSTTGACKAGAQQCVGGALACVGDVKPETEVCDGPPGTTAASFDNDCDGQVNEGCAFPAAGITRLDTLNSTQGQHSSFQLSGAAAGNDFLVAYADGRSNSGDIYGRASTNAGTSWGNNDFVISGEGNVEVEPHVFLRSGQAYVAYSRFEGSIRRIYVRSAASPFTAWSSPVRVDGAPSTAIDCYGPQGVVAKAGATAAQDFIAVLWSEIAGTQAAPTRNIYLRFSKNGGASFDGTFLVNSGPGADKGELPVIASNGNGIVYVAWRDKRTAGLAQTYVGRTDLNQASPTFTNVTALQPNAANASAEQIVIAADSGNNVHVGWVDLRPPKKTIRVASSEDAGLTWSNTSGATGGVVNLDSTFADASAPTIAARAGRVVVAWEDTRSGAADIRVNFSTNSGKTWQPTSARADTGDGLGAATSLAPHVAFGQGDNVLVTWQDLRSPSSAVLANVSIDLGKNFHATAGTTFRMDIDSGNPLAGASADSQYPLVLASPLLNRAAVVWLDYRNNSGANGSNGDVWTRTIE
jgi:Notch-like protein